MHGLTILIGPDDGHANSWQLSLRAILLFFYGIACIRIAGRKTFGQTSRMDIMVPIVMGSNIRRVRAPARLENALS